jgi:hypothetical protein
MKSSQHKLPMRCGGSSMGADIATLGRLYWPLIGALLTIIAIVVVRKHTHETTAELLGELQINLGFVMLPVRFRRSWFVYGFLACATLWAMSFAITRDYSSFFPTRLKLEVFYDRPGIETTMAAMPGLDRIGIRLAKNWWVARTAYYSDLDREAVPELGGVGRFFVEAEKYVHSTGETSFVVKKSRGWQNYHVEESSGEIVHTLEVPNQLPHKLLTSFEKLDTAADYLRPTFSDLVVRHYFIIRPRFKQYLNARRLAGGQPFKATVVGVTTMRVFPLPDFSNTLYLADVPDVGFVPIAYAVYSTEAGDEQER